tara:strand:- start:113 stop:526 length:414 start_codon:yes stop_codon:yes gene_type:complete
MGLFDGIESVEVTQRSEYLQAGSYVLEIQAIKEGTSRKGEDYFLSEFKIIESSNPELPAGAPVTWMYMKRFDSFLKGVKAFIASAANCRVDEVTSEICAAAISDKQPLVGAKVSAFAKDVPTQSGGTFTKVTFSAVH